MKKNNIRYFWEFYKWQIMAAFVMITLGIYLLGAALTKKECILSVMLLDCHTDITQEEMERQLQQALGLDGKKYTVSVESSLMIADTESGSYAMTSLSRLLADIGSEKLDVCGMLEEDFDKYDASGTFLDLRECMDERELRELGDALFVAGDGRVSGVYADSLPGMQKDGCYDALAGGRGVIGIVYNTKHKDMSGDYLMYLAKPE
jgi:hypothetical protein